MTADHPRQGPADHPHDPWPPPAPAPSSRPALQSWPPGTLPPAVRRPGVAALPLTGLLIALVGFVVAGVFLGPAAMALTAAGTRSAYRRRLRGWWAGLAGLPFAVIGLIAHAHVLHLI